MINNANCGAWEIHQTLLTELKRYIVAQYFSKSHFLAKEIPQLLDEKEVLYQDPFVESTVSYLTDEKGIDGSNHLDDWIKAYFKDMAQAKLGVFQNPYKHQIKALDLAYLNKDYIVATGTGSGKTECFMWPILMKMVKEARQNEDSWSRRAVRVIALYPMNALVSDQLSRLRRLMGDEKKQFVDIFHRYSSDEVRRPQFGMYTGRTPYPGKHPTNDRDKKLADTLSVLLNSDAADVNYLNKLREEGKIPAKSNLEKFVLNLQSDITDIRHITDPQDAEMLTRFEMQKASPDILITNYSMLEYMLLRPIEQNIWNETRLWLHSSKENKLLFVIDEAHMYRGASGGEVSLLIRRLMHHLQIGRDQIQFILTTASLPSDANNEVKQFAADLTSGQPNDFEIIQGEKKVFNMTGTVSIPVSIFQNLQLENYSNSSADQLKLLNAFCSAITDTNVCFGDLEEASRWLYSHLLSYKEFKLLCELSQGQAKSLAELGEEIFPNFDEKLRIMALNILLAIAPLAKDNKGSLLFSARMHMLFRGITGVFACTNPNCPGGHKHEGLSLGKLFLNNPPDVCPECHHQVLELYNDRRCGALFFKAYTNKDQLASQHGAFLWKHSGNQISDNLREIYLYIPPEGFKRSTKKTKHPLEICYLDTQSGFVNCFDDSWANKEGIRPLYFCNFEDKGRLGVMTFSVCPHCQHKLQKKEISSFSTKGNLPFYNLVRKQFLLQPPVQGKTDTSKYPNEGRKVLLFSDSRQQAAKLARDMSEYSDNMVIRQLTMRAITRMKQANYDFTLEDLYGFTALEANMTGLTLFDGASQEKFFEDGQRERKSYERKVKRNRPNEYRPTSKDFPEGYAVELLRFFCGPYNTLYDSAICWLEPTEEVLDNILDEVDDEVSSDKIIELFNLWFISVCADVLALGSGIKRVARDQVRIGYQQWGLEPGKYLVELEDQLGFSEEKLQRYNEIFKDYFLSLDEDTRHFFIALHNIRPCINEDHTWYRCNHCSEISPYLWNKSCPHCGSHDTVEMDDQQIALLDYWRLPMLSANNPNSVITRIDIEEHTAQLSHKDQNQALWSKTEEYG